MITSSISEQFVMYSSFFNPVPIKPSSRLIYSFSLASTTLAASMVSKLRSSVSRGYFFPYFSFSILNHSVVYSTIFARCLSISSISAFILAMNSSALSLLNLRIRPILISINLRISSFVTSLIRIG